MRLRDLRTGEERDAASPEVPAGATAVREGDVAWVFYRGETYRLSSVSAARTRRAARGAEDTSPLEAPMPGRILSVRVAAGSAVAKGDVLVVVEAMKMEHAVRAAKEGAVKRVLVSEGQMVGFGDVLVEME